MPSLRKRVSSYFRQLSFINEPKERKVNFDENSMVSKYLQGHIKLKDGPQILYGKNPTDLPNFDLGNYNKGSENIVGCYSGPNGGLTTVKRTEKHLSIPDDDIDFIDTQEETNACSVSQKSPILVNGQGHTVVDNTAMVIRVAGQEYSVINRLRHKKSRSLGSLSNLGIEIEKTKICTPQNKNNDQIFLYENNNKKCDSTVDANRTDNDNILRTNCNYNNNNNDNNIINGKDSHKDKTKIDDNGNKGNKRKESERNEKKVATERKSLKPSSDGANSRHVNNLSKSKSDGNPFRHKKQGKIIKIAHRPTTRPDEINPDSRNSPTIIIDDSKLPNEWNKKSDFVYGLSDSLYDRNQVTKNKNGDPIADCFGIIARQDSAILAVADGVNWGEKACIAAKSAVHGCLHYLNKTIFNDTKPFLNLTIKDDDQTSETESDKTKTAETSHISNTREVFVCLLRAFNCAHDLILENQGMLTTLTVAVVLPLKQKNVKKSEARGISKGENRNGSFKRHAQKIGSNIVNNNDKEDVENYVCCVCNVGDTLAYVYSQKYGVRELTKGSHDINCNRDMRDALGALGPVDGINPELSNLTLSVTTLQKGDLIFVASDGLTDNFDPIVCKFAVNNKTSDTSKTKKHPGNDPRPSDQPSTQKTTQRKEAQRTNSKSPQRSLLHKKKEVSSEQSQTQGQTTSKNLDDVPVVKAKAPQKPPRKSREKLSQERMSCSRQSVSSERSLTSSVSESQKSYDDSSKKSEDKDEFENPLIAQFMRENSLDEKNNLDNLKSNVGTTKTMPVVQQQQTKRDFSSHTPSSSFQNKKVSSSPSSETTSSKRKVQGGPMGLQKSQTTKDVRSAITGNKTIGFSFSNNRPKTEKLTTVAPENPKYRFLRSKTSIDMRPTINPILRNEEGLPYVSPLQRYELTLLMMEDILRRGISGQDSGCVTARKLCENLINFTLSITAGKRHTLEDVDLYYNNVNGVLVEVSSTEKKIRRRKALDRVQNLPGKLDHVSIVAYNVGANGI